ncbi:MAG: hypothetical protein JJU11_18610 [Candidatus Sumerlaeia bacterium]|nr:hypothetical protein [Candidatus Sumerlaeia bacterium]
MISISGEWIYNTLPEYLNERDYKLRHGWLLIKIKGILDATEAEYRNQVMDRVEFIISRDYFALTELREYNKISEDTYTMKMAPFADVFEIYRQLRNNYQLKPSSIL